jgi:hypothetical protein
LQAHAKKKNCKKLLTNDNFMSYTTDKLSNNNNSEVDMKRKIYCGLLVAEAIACAALAVIQESFADAFSTLAAFPFEQIGLGLRALSLSGGPGNAIAIAIYVLLGLSPLAAILLLRKRRTLFPEDGLLALLSVALFVNLYLMINPGFGGMVTSGPAGQAIGKAILGGVIYSIVCGYVILRALRLFFRSDAKRLIRYMKIMLAILGVIFVYIAFGYCVSDMLDSVVNLRAGNVGNENLLGPSYAFLALRFVINALPFILDMPVVFAALRLIAALQAGRYSRATVEATERMSRLCITVLVVTVLTNIAFNVLQLLFVKTILTVNVAVIIPVISVAFVLAALLLTRFAAENKALKDDNDMFI